MAEKDKEPVIELPGRLLKIQEGAGKTKANMTKFMRSVLAVIGTAPATVQELWDDLFGALKSLMNQNDLIRAHQIEQAQIIARLLSENQAIAKRLREIGPTDIGGDPTEPWKS